MVNFLGYALCGKSQIVQFKYMKDGVGDDLNVKIIVNRDGKFKDLSVGTALYVLLENQKTIEVYDRSTLNYNRSIHINQFIKNGRSNDSIKITSMITVNAGGVNLWLGTSHGEIIIIPDRLLQSKNHKSVR